MKIPNLLLESELIALTSDLKWEAKNMYKFGETLQKDGFLLLNKEGDSYMFSIGDCFDDGEEGECMPLFSFSKKLSKERVEELIKYLKDNI